MEIRPAGVALSYMWTKHEEANTLYSRLCERA
jgi:hypothetical protein